MLTTALVAVSKQMLHSKFLSSVSGLSLPLSPSAEVAIALIAALKCKQGRNNKEQMRTHEIQ